VSSKHFQSAPASDCYDGRTTLTGCEDSLIVNNNAAATLLTLQSLCAGREVIISRGQLIEIGGSFRLLEIFTLSGARLREVGTTNRTRIEDYAAAIHSRTAAILRVNPSLEAATNCWEGRNAASSLDVPV